MEEKLCFCWFILFILFLSCRILFYFLPTCQIHRSLSLTPLPPTHSVYIYIYIFFCNLFLALVLLFLRFISFLLLLQDRTLCMSNALFFSSHLQLLIYKLFLHHFLCSYFSVSTLFIFNISPL